MAMVRVLFNSLVYEYTRLRVWTQETRAQARTRAERW